MAMPISSPSVVRSSWSQIYPCACNRARRPRAVSPVDDVALSIPARASVVIIHGWADPKAERSLQPKGAGRPLGCDFGHEGWLRK